MNKIAFFLTALLVLTCFTACESFRDFIDNLRPIPPSYRADSELLVEYNNQASKDEFQKQYKLAYENDQPDYTKDFIYEYYNDAKETELGGKVNLSNSNSVYLYDADSDILFYTYEFQDNDEPTSYMENYYHKYRISGDKLIFFSSRTNKTEERQLGFDEFWEFAHSQIPFVLFPNPYKLFDDTVYYLSLIHI